MQSAVAQVAVVGGGLSGLTAAYRLQQAGVSCIVLERSDRLGGRVKTVNLAGCVIDTGAVGMLGSYAQMAGLARELGLADRLSRSPVRMAVPRDGKWHVIDMGRIGTIIGTKLLSGAAKWRLRKLGGPMIRLWKRMNFDSVAGMVDADTESVGTFAKRELSPESYQFLIGPIIRALWQRDADDTPAIDLFCSLKIFAPTMYAVQGGLQRVPDALAGKVKAITGAVVHSVEDRADGVLVVYEVAGEMRSELFGQTVLAVPPANVVELIKDCPPPLAAAFAAQPYSCSVNVHFALSKPLGGDVLVMFPPESEAPDLTTAVFEHNKKPGHAPAGKGSLSLYWRDSWSRAHMATDDASVIRDAIEQTRRVIPELDASIVEAAHVERWPFAGVCRAVGGTRALAEIEQAASRFHNLALAGDYFVLSGMNGAIVSGERAARRVLELRTSRY